MDSERFNPKPPAPSLSRVGGKPEGVGCIVNGRPAAPPWIPNRSWIVVGRITDRRGSWVVPAYVVTPDVSVAQARFVRERAKSMYMPISSRGVVDSDQDFVLAPHRTFTIPHVASITLLRLDHGVADVRVRRNGAGIH